MDKSGAPFSPPLPREIPSSSSGIEAPSEEMAPSFAEQLETAVIGQLCTFNPTFARDFPVDIDHEYIHTVAEAFTPIVADDAARSAAFIRAFAPVLAKFQELTLVKDMPSRGNDYLLKLKNLETATSLTTVKQQISSISQRFVEGGSLGQIVDGTETKQQDITAAFKERTAGLHTAFETLYAATQRSYLPKKADVHVGDKTIPVFLYPNCDVSEVQAQKLLTDIARIDPSLVQEDIPIHFSKMPYEATMAGGYSSTGKKITLYKPAKTTTEGLACTLAHELEHAKQHKQLEGVEEMFSIYDPLSCVVIDRMMEGAAYTKGAFVLYKLQEHETAERKRQQIEGPGPYAEAYLRIKTGGIAENLTHYGHIMGAIERTEQEHAAHPEKDKMALEKGFEAFYRGGIPDIYAANMVRRYHLLAPVEEKETLSSSEAHELRQTLAPYAESISDITLPIYTRISPPTLQKLKAESERVHAVPAAFFDHNLASSSAPRLTGIRADLAKIDTQQQSSSSQEPSVRPPLQHSPQTTETKRPRTPSPTAPPSTKTPQPMPVIPQQTSPQKRATTPPLRMDRGGME